MSTQDTTVEFDVEGTRYTLAQMLQGNVGEEDFCAWARTAKSGDFFPGLIQCQCIAIGDLSETDLREIDRQYDIAKDSGALDRARQQRTEAQELQMLRSKGLI